MKHSSSRLRQNSGGYVLIASLCIVVIIIGLWLYYASPLQTAPGGELKNIEQQRTQGLEAIKAAEHAKTLLEKNPLK